jgi:RimJ/RimL family protein N-acetyltransferase
VTAQPVGAAVPGWRPPARVPRTALEGRLCRVVPLDAAAHADDLFDAYAADTDAHGWTYLAYGPFATRDALRHWIDGVAGGADPLFFAVIDRATDRAVGVASYLRIDPAAGSAEVGHIRFSPRLQRTALATECMHLMMARVFTLGYRRYEWKCDALNAPSRAAARRLGFSFEGLFRQATVYKGRNRDTAWFSVLDTEWPAIDAGFRAWLDPANFDADGRQRTRLNDHLPPGRDIVRLV